MSYIDTLLVQCEDLQGKLGTVWGKDVSTVNDPIPFLEYIASDSNKNNVDMTINPGDGKTRTVNVTYFQRLLETSVEEVTERGCATDNENGNLAATYEIDTTDLVKSGEKIKATNLTRFCENNGEYIASVILRHLNVIDRKVASKTAAEAKALLGGWSGDTEDAYTVTNDALIVQTLDDSGNYAIGAIEDVEAAAKMSSYSGFLMFGGNAMNSYLRRTLAGCCANQGLDVLELYRQYGYAFAYDRRLATELGSVLNSNMIMEPESLQLLNYVETPWRDEITIEMRSGYEAFPMTTPAGVDVDVYIKDECPGEISINVFANTKLVGLPDDMFASGDNFEGVTYAAEVTVDNS